MSGLFNKGILPVIICLCLLSPARASRIKDIAFFEGVRTNHLVGYGLVVGLDGTGDKSGAVYTKQSIANMFVKLGIKIAPGDIKVKNTAAVMLTAELPPFMRPGSRIDILVSSVGDAKSLNGGTLIMTSLKGADGRVYASAQGPVSLGGFLASGSGVSLKKNHQTVGRIPGGALVERAVPLRMGTDGELLLTLREPDFTTIEQMAEVINKALGAADAIPLDAGTVRITLPLEGVERGLYSYIREIEQLDVSTDSVSKVVINERTGTVVLGAEVTISEVAVSHGDISIEIKTQYLISQPNELAAGKTVVQPQAVLGVKEKESRLIVLPKAVRLKDVVRALNLVGVTPRDLVAILEAMKAAGALHAELEII
ncbi:MAG: flagellar basal body P-ring protein FlgI [Thermodesulfobacteriota bacterium]